MSCSISNDILQEVTEFHGHNCPGLAIGVRASELCLKELGHNNESPLVAICETDMCGVDAISFLTGCTVGKGNLLFRDHGKMAFTFFRRDDGKGFRALLKPDAHGSEGEQMRPLMKKVAEGTASEEEKRLNQEIRKKVEENIFSRPLDELFEVSPPQMDMPKGAKILQSLCCDECGENTMESRTRRFDGRTLCIPCFSRFEQKI